MIDEVWLADALAGVAPGPTESPGVDRLMNILRSCADAFAARRSDVVSPKLFEPARGLRHDEASSFLAAVDSGFAQIDPAGFVTLPTVRVKRPTGRYALLAKSGSGVSVNHEYLVQVGAAYELVRDLAWSGGELDFERGEFDALGHGNSGRPVLVMEAKARATGRDSLETLVRAWLMFARDQTASTESNPGRKWTELQRLCSGGPVRVWLVADAARWALTARLVGSMVELAPAIEPHRANVQANEEASMIEAIAYDPDFHRPGTRAAGGACSWHGVTCQGTPVVSFQDQSGDRQSGCERSVRELVERGEMAAPQR
ncbi:hypothetical protein ISU10_02405 [Nocardioides agariphilus]|uniref:Uncharacterized protein n=1 Tax=Nocardioides agariphilus TaxID=433664 RepID=A0A930YH17_9ACTN|nr:hypothetical protein [Nocardioides agariphilus]MBF4766617.1 hypothetical protein [Nocardioides agariphilus]